MEIKLGKVYENKTSRLLLPCINSFDADFIEYYNNLFKLAVGIHDTLLDHSPLIKGNNLYLLFDTSVNNTLFYQFLSWITEKDCFQAEYSVDEDLVKARKHMVVINVPKCHNEDYMHFLKGEFSKMYTEAFKVEHFLKKGRIEAFGVLSKDKTHLKKLMKSLDEEFKSEVLEKDLQEHEVEIPLKREEEIFNCIKHQRVFFNEELDKVWQN